MELRAQPGYQEKFLSCGADIVFGGGKAGAGKTFSLLVDPLRYQDLPRFRGILFRRTTPEITNPGALWDEASELYLRMGKFAPIPRLQDLLWRFRSGSRIKFSHLENEKDKYKHQGGQYGWIGFDELTHFTSGQFFYLVGRARSLAMPPCIRATCNPEPESWVAKFIEWWIDPETGYIIPERDGVVRYFCRVGDDTFWGDSKAELLEKHPHIVKYARPEDGVTVDDLIMSFTFIEGDIYENKALLSKNPQYLANLLSQDAIEQAKLLEGNWRISQDGLALGEYSRVQEIDSNYPERTEGKAMTVDTAGWGSDLAVIKSWEGMYITKLTILSKCGQDELYKAVENDRAELGCGKSDVIVDMDGIGVGLVDFGKYRGFNNGGMVVQPKKAKSHPEFTEMYDILKTQCYYHLFEDYINNGNYGINPDNIWIDGVKTRTLKKGNKSEDVVERLKRELRAIKRKDPDRDGKRKINPKEEQKELLGGQSPDLADASMMRVYTFLKPKLVIRGTVF